MPFRAHFIVAFLLSSVLPLAARAQNVAWLDEVQRPPENAPREGLGKLAPLLTDAQGRAITTRAQWEQQRQQLRAAWLKFLGPMPDPRPASKFEVLQTTTDDKVRRELIRYECEPKVFVEAYLLRPTDITPGQRRPGIVALHPTTNTTIDETAGMQGPTPKALGDRLAREGFVVICPRCFLWQDVADINAAVARHRERHPETLGMAKMLYDAMRAVDILTALPEVDAKRIGAVGHSLGAKEVLYLMAFDERVAAGVASEGGLGFRSTNWDAPWYLGTAIRDEEFPLNHHQLLALIAPRPLLILGGETGPGAADGDRSWPLIDAALPVWRLYGEPPRIGLLNHHEGHSIPPKAATALSEWLATYTK
jgi:dienelactone hydrolase